MQGIRSLSPARKCGLFQLSAWDGNPPDFDGAEECRCELGRIVEQQEHSLFHFDAEGPESIARAVDRIREIRIGVVATFITKDRSIAPPFGNMPVDKFSRCVEDIHCGARSA